MEIRTQYRATQWPKVFYVDTSFELRAPYTGGDIGERLLGRLLEVPGVMSINFAGRYVLVVQIGELFDWLQAWPGVDVELRWYAHELVAEDGKAVEKAISALDPEGVLPLPQYPAKPAMPLPQFPKKYPLQKPLPLPQLPTKKPVQREDDDEKSRT